MAGTCQCVVRNQAGRTRTVPVKSRATLTTRAAGERINFCKIRRRYQNFFLPTQEENNNLIDVRTVHLHCSDVVYSVYRGSRKVVL